MLSDQPDVRSHRIGKLDVSVAIADLDQAMALRPRLETLANRVFPQVLEQVFDRLGPEDGYLQIGTLALDLGRLRPAWLEADATTALEQALGEALAGVLHAVRQGSDGTVRLVAEGPWRLQHLARYLESGTIVSAAAGEAFDAAGQFKALMAQDAAALIALLRRLAQQPQVIERLVLQLGDAELAGLLALLDPAGETIVGELVAELVRLYAPITARDPARLTRAVWRALVWMAALDMVLLETGTQFDLRRYSDGLVTRLAARMGIGLTDLRARMARAVTPGRRRLPSRALAEWLTDLPPLTQARADADLLAAMRRGERLDPAQVRSLAQQADDDDFRALVLELAGERAQVLLAMLERRVARTARSDRAARQTWLRERVLRALVLRREARLDIGDDRRAVAAYLVSGSPVEAGAQIPALAAADPAWLAEQARRGAGSPAAAQAVAARLLEWLLPEEIVAVLAPGRAVAEVSEGSNWWHDAIAALLQGLDLPAPTAGPATGARDDRLAALSEWLDGTAPFEGADAALMAVTIAERISLFSANREDLVLARLQRAAKGLRPDTWHCVIKEFAPWAKSDRGVLAPLLAGRSAADRQAIRLRAAAAALIGDSLAFDRLADPLPDIADPEPAPPRTFAMETPDLPTLLDWLDGATGSGLDAAALGEDFVRRLDAGDPHLINWLATRRARAADRARWAAVLPVRALGRLLHLLAPGAAATLHDAIRMVTAAARHAAPFDARPPDQRALWALVLDAATASVRIAIPQVVAQLIRTVAAGDTDRAEKVRARTLKLADMGGHLALAAALRRPLANQQRPPAQASGPSRAPAAAPAPDKPIYIANAGLVLVHPFLPMLLDRLNLLTQDGDGRARVPPGAALTRACHLLQYLVDGRLDAPEPQLVLNKLLCGAPTVMPVARDLVPRPDDLALCDELLGAVIANWPMLANTSIEGLQETFLQREGRLHWVGGKWTLQVQRKTLDVLTDQIPWSLSVVYHRWMPEPIYVTW